MKKKLIKFFTYTPKILKSQTILLKGVDTSFKPEEIEQEIWMLDLPYLKLIKVIEFFTDQKNRENNKFSFFLVQLSAASTLSNLTNVKFMLNQVVTWERLRKRDPIICSRCQRAGHSKNNCNLDYRCIKCDKNHGPGDCLILKEQKVV